MEKVSKGTFMKATRTLLIFLCLGLLNVGGVASKTFQQINTPNQVVEQFVPIQHNALGRALDCPWHIGPIKIDC